MSPAPPHVDETERVQGPLTLSETCTWPDAPAWPNHPSSTSPAATASVRVRAYDVEGAAGGGGGGLWRRGGRGMEDGAHREPVGGGAEGGRSLLGPRRARRDVLCERGAVRILRPRRVRDAGAAPGRDRAGIVAGDQGGEHQLTRIHRSGRTRVDGRSDTARRRDLVERAGEGDARVVGDGTLQVRGGGGGDGYGNGQPPGRRLAVLAVVEGDVPCVVHEVQRPGTPRPRAVHVVRYLNLRGIVVLGNPPHQQIPLGDRAGECDRDRRDPRPGRERGSLDEGGGGRLSDGRAGEEDSQNGNHGKARTGVGRGQKFHGNSAPLQGRE